MRDGMKALRNMYEGKLPEDLVESYVQGFARPGRLTAALNYYRANGKPGGGRADHVVRVAVSRQIKKKRRSFCRIASYVDIHRRQAGGPTGYRATVIVLLIDVPLAVRR